MPESHFTKHSRRAVLTALGTTVVSSGSAHAAIPRPKKAEDVRTVPAFSALASDLTLKAGTIVQTLGYYEPGDTGAASYEITAAPAGQHPQPVGNGLFARLLHNGYINYRMFGAGSDGQSDDGVAIKKAHEYANEARIPVLNLSGEFWLKDTKSIPVRTITNWGNTVFHIDESLNSAREPHFEILPERQSFEITLTSSQKASLIQHLRPGVKLIPELAGYTNCLVIVSDENDRIGRRYGPDYNPKGWAREEFFYVEEHGRIIGDIAWTFKDYTHLTAFPCDDSFLILEGGTFLLSGNNPGKIGGPYYQGGITAKRSRTIIRNQWVGLEKEHRDTSLTPRAGFYNFRNVYDILLENIRLIPWEKDREGTDKDLKAGTYGIGGARVLCGTFRNITAEGSQIHWGVFGTNLYKNFKIESCRLNRVDVHFHGWNIVIKDSEIGQKGLTLTGGGELLIENTRVFHNQFVNFRQDYGAKWDGPIRIINCRVIPQNGSGASVISMLPGDFDYRYPIVLGHQIVVRDFVFVSAPSWNNAKYTLIRFPSFSKSKEGLRLTFPHRIEFNQISVYGRERGVQLLDLPDMSSFRTPHRKGGCTNGVLLNNSTMHFENIALDDDPQTPNFRIGLSEAYLDEYAPYPSVSIVNCDYLNASLADSLTSVHVKGSLVRQFSAGEDGDFNGSVFFENCRFQADIVPNTRNTHYRLRAKTGISFLNCEINLPLQEGKPSPENLKLIDFLKINANVRHNHLNTRLGTDLSLFLTEKGIKLKKDFISMIRNRHELEAENI